MIPVELKDEDGEVRGYALYDPSTHLVSSQVYDTWDEVVSLAAPLE